MKRVLKWSGYLLAAMLVAVTLSGCGGGLMLTLSPQELYTLPALPAKYTELNSRINEILDGGAEYAAPTSGSNIQSVQMVDLDGDGREEALAFFRKMDDEKPLKIYVFAANGDSYRQTDLIEGSGTAVYSIDYKDLDGDGRKELVVGWRAATELMLEVYTLRSGGADMLMRSNYVRYTVRDMDQDGRQELVVLRADEEGGIADYYSWQDNRSLLCQSSARLSVTMAELSQQGRVVSGTLRDGVPAVFVTGVVEQSGAVTDVLALRNGELSSLLLSEQTGVSKLVYPFSSLYPTDINNDGLTEVPCPAYLLSLNDDESAQQRIDWLSYDSEGEGEIVVRTFHCVEDGWYLQLPEDWTDHIYISRSAAQDESSVTFYTRESGQLPQPFLRITAVTGANREIKAIRGGRFLLSRQPKTLYTAELLEGNDGWHCGVSADEVRSAFSLIQTEWLSGDD